MRKQETEQESKYNTNYTVIFGQFSLENSNVGKLVQQRRILFFSNSSVQLGAKLAYAIEKNSPTLLPVSESSLLASA